MLNILVMLGLNEIGREIAAERKKRRLGQRKLAESAGVSRSTIDLIENGRATEIGYSKLARILSAVGLELRLEPTASERPTLDDLLREDAGDD
jgi:transcriptional regulator with XRE-family HTH domain